jgi:hypothetical protein
MIVEQFQKYLQISAMGFRKKALIAGIAFGFS